MLLIVLCLSAAIERSFRGSNPWMGSARTGRSQRTIDPFLTRKALLGAYEHSIGEAPLVSRQGKTYFRTKSFFFYF